MRRCAQHRLRQRCAPGFSECLAYPGAPSAGQDLPVYLWLIPPAASALEGFAEAF